MSAPTTGQLADIPDHLPAIAPPIGPAVDVLAVLRALERMPSVVVNLDGVHIPRPAVQNVTAAMAKLIEAGKRMLDSYKAAHDSGDWGNWDLEKDDEYVALRAALARVGGAA